MNSDVVCQLASPPYPVDFGRKRNGYVATGLVWVVRIGLILVFYSGGRFWVRFVSSFTALEILCSAHAKSLSGPFTRTVCWAVWAYHIVNELGPFSFVLPLSLVLPLFRFSHSRNSL